MLFWRLAGAGKYSNIILESWDLTPKLFSPETKNRAEVKQDKDWKTKYQALIEEIEGKETEWTDIEAILRKTIARLSIAGRGFDDRLDEHLIEIQKLSRDHKDEKLGLALEKLASVVAILDDKPAATTGAGNNEPDNAADTSSLLLELLQSIEFTDDQRARLKPICSDLLKALANGSNRASIKSHILSLSALISENFSVPEAPEKTSPSDAIVLELIGLLGLDESTQQLIDANFSKVEKFTKNELNSLAQIVKAKILPAESSSNENNAINEVLTTLLERLIVVQGSGHSASALQSRVLDGIEDSQWPETLEKIVSSITDTLSKLNEEKLELETFIINVTEQLGQITEVIVADREDHQSNRKDRQSLQSLMRESVQTIQNKVESASDILQLKTVVVHNIDQIRAGVEEFMQNANTRQTAIEDRNNDLLEKISAMEKETEKLQQTLSENRKKLLFDSLTGVGSRLSYDENLAQELARWQRYGTSFSYAILDIDHFKGINDKYGHSAGDKALKITAKMMLHQIRKSDSIFRIGGEEFVLLLPNTSIEQAEPLVNKLREAIANSDIHCKQERVVLTLSAGLTEPKGDDNITTLYERADSALYRAKNSGRNCQFVA